MINEQKNIKNTTLPITQYSIRKVTGLLSNGINVATHDFELQKIINFKKGYYQGNRDNIKAFHDDGANNKVYVLFGKDVSNNITSTARLIFDSESGFPEEEILPNSVKEMRVSGKKIAELGRLVITENKVKMLRLYYKSIFNIAKFHSIDVVLIIMKTKNIRSHKKIMAITVLSNEMGNSWDDNQEELSLVAWDMKSKQPKFNKWISRDLPVFGDKSWDSYSHIHASVLVSVQHEVYNYTKSKLYGRTIDLGCGSARVMGYIQENPRVTSYLGIDTSSDMIKQASRLKEQLQYTNATFETININQVSEEYDSVLSIHSYYSWTNTRETLAHIYKILKTNGVFILITPNNKFDQQKLSRLVMREVAGHPFYEEFLSINYGIANTYQYQSIDKLIEEVKQVGFIVTSAHDDFFLGGASCLELTKIL